MPQRLLVVRHGETDWNLARRWQGHTDVALNDTGRRQAQAVAARLRHWSLEAVYSSDLRRALETANPIAEPQGLTVMARAAWRERCGGSFEGLTADELRARHPDVWAAFERGEALGQGSESYAQLEDRVLGALDELRAAHGKGTVALVTHGGVLRTIICHVLGVAIRDRERIGVSGNTGLSIIDFTTDGPTLTLLNDTAHLESRHG